MPPYVFIYKYIKKAVLFQVLNRKTKLFFYCKIYDGIGAYMCQGTCMAIYNTRSTKMKWTPKTENKTKSIYQLYANTICKSATIDALMFGTDFEISYETIR